MREKRKVREDREVREEREKGEKGSQKGQGCEIEKESEKHHILNSKS